MIPVRSWDFTSVLWFKYGWGIGVSLIAVEKLWWAFSSSPRCLENKDPNWSMHTARWRGRYPEPVRCLGYISLAQGAKSLGGSEQCRMMCKGRQPASSRGMLLFPGESLYLNKASLQLWWKYLLLSRCCVRRFIVHGKAGHAWAGEVSCFASSCFRRFHLCVINASGFWRSPG